jgi:hypothetical protein
MEQSSQLHGAQSHLNSKEQGPNSMKQSYNSMKLSHNSMKQSPNSMEQNPNTMGQSPNSMGQSPISMEQSHLNSVEQGPNSMKQSCNSMKQSPITACSRAVIELMMVNQTLTTIPALYNLTHHYHVHHSLQCVPNLSKINPIHTLPTSFFTIQSDIIHSSKPRSAE